MEATQVTQIVIDAVEGISPVALSVLLDTKSIVEGLDVEAYLCPSFPALADPVYRVDLLDLKGWVMAYVVTDGTTHQYVEAPNKVIIQTDNESDLHDAITRHLIEWGF